MRYPPLLGTFRRITHPFATRQRSKLPVTVRLACVKHAASVQSEPGSNSSVQSHSNFFGTQVQRNIVSNHLQCKYLAWPDTYTYRLFVLLKSGAALLVSFAASAEETNYSEPTKCRQRLFCRKMAVLTSYRIKTLIYNDKSKQKITLVFANNWQKPVSAAAAAGINPGFAGFIAGFCYLPAFKTFTAAQNHAAAVRNVLDLLQDAAMPAAGG